MYFLRTLCTCNLYACLCVFRLSQPRSFSLEDIQKRGGRKESREQQIASKLAFSTALLPFRALFRYFADTFPTSFGHFSKKHVRTTGPKSVPNMSDTCPKHVRKTCPKHVRNMYETSTKRVPNMSETCPNHIRQVSSGQVFPTCVGRHVFRTCFGHVSDICRILCGRVSDMFGILFGHVSDTYRTFGTLVGHFRGTFMTLFGHFAEMLFHVIH
jgi:hypothetical protein